MEAEAARSAGNGEEIEESEDGEEDEPDDTGGEEAAERVGRPEDGDCEVEREESKEEEAAVR